MVNTSEDGMNRSIVVFSGRMARLKNVPSRTARLEGPGVGGRVDVADTRLLSRARVMWIALGGRSSWAGRGQDVGRTWAAAGELKGGRPRHGVEGGGVGPP
ncbi:hypothetical protein GCM10022241_13840 [Micrococcus endophyticus]